MIVFVSIYTCIRSVKVLKRLGSQRRLNFLCLGLTVDEVVGCGFIESLYMSSIRYGEGNVRISYSKTFT